MKHTPLTLTDILIAATLSPLSVGAFWQPRAVHFRPDDLLLLTLEFQ
jgi:hypothetical protein